MSITARDIADGEYKELREFVKQFAHRHTAEDYIRTRNTGPDRGSLQPQQRAALDWWFGEAVLRANRRHKKSGEVYYQVVKYNTRTGRHEHMTPADREKAKRQRPQLIAIAERRREKRESERKDATS